MHNDGSAQPSAAVRFVLQGETFTQIEDWRRAHEKIPSRPDAIRELLKTALRTAKQTVLHAERNRRSAIKNRDAA